MSADNTAVSGKAGGSFWRTLRTVGAGLFGVRGKARHEADTQAVSPVHVLVAALAFMVLFVVGLVSLASSIAAK